MLHLLGVLALQEANECLTPRPPADEFSPKASEGMCFGLHPVFSFGRYIFASLSWYELSDGNSSLFTRIAIAANLFSIVPLRPPNPRFLSSAIVMQRKTTFCSGSSVLRYAILIMLCSWKIVV